MLAPKTIYGPVIRTMRGVVQSDVNLTAVRVSGRANARDPSPTTFQDAGAPRGFIVGVDDLNSTSVGEWELL